MPIELVCLPSQVLPGGGSEKLDRGREEVVFLVAEVPFEDPSKAFHGVERLIQVGHGGWVRSRPCCGCRRT